MSDEGRSHVKINSPYKGSTFFVHYFLGDLANDTGDNKLWLSMRKLGRTLRMDKSTVARAVATLVEDGHLEMVEDRPGTTNVYRFRFDGVGESSNPVSDRIPSGRILPQVDDVVF